MADPRLTAVTLDGRHVRLEPLTRAHAADLLAAADADRTTYGFTQVPADLAGMEAYIDTALRRADQLPFATVRVADGRVVGSTRLLDISFWFADDELPSSCEIGATWLAAEAQRTPINTEAKLLQLTHAFEVWGVVRVQLKTDARNERSRRAIERLGARFEGVLRKYQPALPGPGPRDTAMYSITDTEWPEVRAALRQRLGF